MLRQIHTSAGKNRKIVFLVQEICSPIFQVQSLPILLELKKEFEIKIISIEDDLPKKIASEEFQKSSAILVNNFKLEIITYRDIFILPKIINQIIQLVPQLYFKSKKNQFYFFHARGYVPAIVLHYLKKIFSIKFIFDMRGVFVDELKLLHQYSEKNIRIRFWRHLEQCAIKSSEFTVVVSKPFKRYVENIDPFKQSFVIKNAIIKKKLLKNNFIKIRQKQREKLRVHDKIVWVYSGSLYKWQLFPKMIEYFSIVNSIFTNLYFLVICNEKADVAENLFVKWNIPKANYKVVSVHPSNVINYMIAGDIGLLLRNRSIINEVSDPLKFVEYLYTGLFVIISQGIGDTEELVGRYNLGVVLESNEKSEFIDKYKLLNEKLKDKDPMKIISSVSRVYDFKASCNQYKNMYQILDY